MREWAKNPGCLAGRKVGREVKDSGSWTTWAPEHQDTGAPPALLSSALTSQTGSNWKPGIDSLLSPLQVCSKVEVVCLRLIRKGSWDWCLSTGKGRKQDWAEVEVELWCNLYGAPRWLCGLFWSPDVPSELSHAEKRGQGLYIPPLISHQKWAIPGEEVPVFSGSSWSKWTAGLDAGRALGSQRRTLCAWRRLGQHITVHHTRRVSGTKGALCKCTLNEWTQWEPWDRQGTNYIVTFTMWFRGSKKWLVH